MHPAKSVIFFTVASGAGYGLFMALVIALNLEFLYPHPKLILLAGSLSFVLVTSGLLSSTFHLGHPERAWMALSQWRSSWLSREGVLAILTYLPAMFYIFGLLYEPGPWVKTMGWIAALMCFLTVYATSMIYRSLKPIAAWSNKLTTPVYLTMALTSGFLILNLFIILFEGWLEISGYISLGLLIIVLILKDFYWRLVDKNETMTNIGTATGLGDKGTVTPLEQPHTEDNYLLKEMGFQIARKHSKRLRYMFLTFWFLSIFLIAGSLYFYVPGLPYIGSLALLFTSLAIIIERWLFFAEAKHTVALYYRG